MYGRLILSATKAKAGWARDVEIESIEARAAARVNEIPRRSINNGSSGAKKPTYMSLKKCPMDKPNTRPDCMGSSEFGRDLCFDKIWRSCYLVFFRIPFVIKKTPAMTRISGKI